MQNARPLCKKVQPMPVTIFRASVWANVLEEGQETSQITTQIGQENGKEGQEKGKNYQAAHKKLLPDSAWLK